jgi:hypothetical protein
MNVPILNNGGSVVILILTEIYGTTRESLTQIYPSTNRNEKSINHSLCSRILLVYLFIRFGGIGYGPFIAMRYNFKLSTYVQEPLVLGRRGCVQTEI